MPTTLDESNLCSLMLLESSALPRQLLLILKNPAQALTAARSSLVYAYPRCAPLSLSRLLAPAAEESSDSLQVSAVFQCFTLWQNSHPSTYCLGASLLDARMQDASHTHNSKGSSQNRVIGHSQGKFCFTLQNGRIACNPQNHHCALLGI